MLDSGSEKNERKFEEEEKTSNAVVSIPANPEQEKKAALPVHQKCEGEEESEEEEEEEDEGGEAREEVREAMQR